MAEYISRDDVRSMILKYRADNPKKQTIWAMVISDMLRDLKEIPAADVQPVKRGKWLHFNDDGIIFCSECHKEAYWDTDYGQQLFDYCPNCGADMRGED